MKSLANLVVLFISTSAVAGSVVTLESREFNADPPSTGTVAVSVQGEAMRLEASEPSSGESGSLLYNRAANEMTAIDHERREFYVFDEQTMQQMAGQVSDAMRQMQQAMAELPPEQRAMAEKMMKQRMGQFQETITPQRLEKTGESDSVNGYDCEMYNVFEADRKMRDMCVTPWGDIEGGSEMANAMVEMAEFFESIRESFAQSGMDMMGSRSEVFSHMRDIKGFPVRSRDYDASGRLERESNLVSSEMRDIDPALFQPPAGYKKGSLQ